jgi:predicted DNA-binding transcriptional regulator AlpA
MPTKIRTRPNRVHAIRDAAPPPEDGEERLLDKPQIITITGKSFPTLWGMMRRGEFPAARIVGGKPAWLQSEINTWIRELPVKKYKGDQ